MLHYFVLLTYSPDILLNLDSVYKVIYVPRVYFTFYSRLYSLAYY